MTSNAILVAIGANLSSSTGSPPLLTCKWAAHQLSMLYGMRLCRLSRWFETQPVPVSEQPAFINGVALLEGTADPLALLDALHRLEAKAGRVRTTANAARTLDLDILAMGGLALSTPRLTIPHPRLQDRAFVLAPLADVLPEWRHPLLGLSARQMLAALSGQQVRAL